MIRVVLFILPLCVAVHPTLASARPVDKETRAQAGAAKAKAKGLLRQGNLLHKQGKYQQALQQFRRAYALYPSYKIKFNIAAALFALDRPEKAASAFADFLALAGPKTPQDIIQIARARMSMLERKVASVIIKCKQEKVEVKVNNGPGKVPRHYLAPGKHRLLLQKPGFQAYGLVLVLGPGEHKEIAVSLAPATARPAATSPPAHPKDGAVLLLARRHHSKTVWAATTLGAGLALTAGAAVLYGLGGSQGSQAHEDYLLATEEPLIALYRAEVEASRTKLTVGHALMGVAAVFFAVSIYHFITRPEIEEQMPATGPSIGLAPSSEGAALTLSGRF